LGIAAVAGGAWLLAGGAAEALMVLFLFVLLPALLALLGVALTLIIRRGLILLLIIISPVAVALYCLPNTEKYFRQWFSLFIKTLMVYPIIAAIFGMANILAVVISKANQANGPVSSFAGLVSIIVLILPLFLIPYSFKLAGGAIGSLHDQFTNYRKKGHQGILGNPNDKDSLRNTKLREWGTQRELHGRTPGQIGAVATPRMFTRRGRERVRGKLDGMQQSGAERYRKQMESTDKWGAAMQDSNITAALGLFKNGDEARAAVEYWAAENKGKMNPDEYKRIRRQKMAAIGSAENIGYTPSNRRAGLNNANTIGYELKKGPEGWDQAMKAMESISGGDPFQFRSLQDEFQAIAKGPAGRPDLAANTGGDPTYNLDTATASVDPYQLIHAKKNAPESFIEQHMARLKDPTASDIQRQKSAVFLHEMRNAQAKNQAVGGVRDAMVDNQKAMDDTYNDYIKQQVAIRGATALPSSRREYYKETTINPATGAEETRDTSRIVPITNTADAQKELARIVEQELEAKSRAYVPIDPNNRP
jgi:hypothetical protein